MSIRSVSRLTAPGLIFLFVAGMAAAQEVSTEMVILDFEELAAGEIISAARHPGTDRMIRIRGVNPGFEQNAAVIFDSSNPGPEDLDLGSPHREFEIPGEDGNPRPGPGRGDGGARGMPCQNDRPLGKLLIVDDDLKPLDAEGRVEVPDDEARAGARVLVDFSELGPVTIHGLTVMDVEEPDAEVWLYNVGIAEREEHQRKRQVLAHYRVHTENNGVARLFDPEIRNVPEEGCHVTLVRRKDGRALEPLAGVMSLEVAFNGSGAIARITYSAPGGQDLSEEARGEGSSR